MMDFAGLGQDSPALFDIGARQPHHQRDLDAHFMDRLDDAFGHPVAAVDAGENVDEDRLDILVGQNRAERFRHALRRSAAADIEEVGGLAAGDLDHVHGRHGEPGAVDDAADIAVETDIGKAAVAGEGLARVLLRLVAQFGDFRPAEQRVLVERHLGVERDQDSPSRVTTSGLISSIEAS